MRPGLYDSLLTARLRAQVDALTNVTAQIHDLADPDLRPHPFQEEILEQLVENREGRGLRRNLVVAATGTVRGAAGGVRIKSGAETQ